MSSQHTPPRETTVDDLLSWNPPPAWMGEDLWTLLLVVAGMAAGCVMQHAPDVEMPSKEIEEGLMRVLIEGPR